VQDTVRSWLPDAGALSVADVLRLGAGDDAGRRLGEPCRRWPPGAGRPDGRPRARRRPPGRHAAGPPEAIARAGRTGQAAGAASWWSSSAPASWSAGRRPWRLAEGATTPEAAQDRALTEATAFAIRIDVAEELTRLAAHLDEIERLVKKGGEVGKRLDFLIQELHREANTLGSKSAALELTRISVDMKVLIEQMREQVQNIE
jgi:hypothetical protein